MIKDLFDSSMLNISEKALQLFSSSMSGERHRLSDFMQCFVADNASHSDDVVESICIVFSKITSLWTKELNQLGKIERQDFRLALAYFVDVAKIFVEKSQDQEMRLAEPGVMAEIAEEAVVAREPTLQALTQILTNGSPRTVEILAPHLDKLRAQMGFRGGLEHAQGVRKFAGTISEMWKQLGEAVAAVAGELDLDISGFRSSRG